jgi:PAS domain S-box-containing protein
MITEIQFQTFFERNSLGMAFVNKDEQFIEVNDAMCRLTGYSRDEMLKMNVIDIYSSDNLFIKQSEREQMHRGEIDHVQVERKAVLKNGNFLYVNIHITTVVDELGNFEYELGVFENITERKQAERQLYDLEIRFESIYQLSPIAIILCDMDWNIRTANTKACKLFGYTEQELKKMNVSDISHPAYMQINEQLVKQKLLNKEDDFFIEKKYIKKDGSVINGEVTANIIYNEQKQPLYIMGMVVDVTQRKQKELELQKSELMYSSLVKNIPGVVYHCIEDDHWTMLYLSEQVEELTGYKAQDFIDNKVSFSNIIIKNDYVKLVDAYANNKKLKLGDTFNEYYRIRHANGSIRWIHEKGQYFDKKGEQWFLYGLMFDITEQKEQENNLLQSQMRFKSVFENNNLPIVIADVDGTIIELNEAFCHLTGYTMQEAMKMKVFEYIHPDSPRTTTEDGNAFVSGKVKALSNLNRIIQTKNGEKRYLNVNLSGVYNEHNELLYDVSIMEDVTEKRIIAQALEQSVAMQRALLNAIPDLVFHVHRDGTYLNAFIPQTMELETRRSKDDIVGKNILELIPNPTGQNLYNFLLSALDSKQVETYEYSAIVNNEELFYESKANAINNNEVIFSTRNITSIKKTAQALEQSVAMQQAILKSLPDLTFHIDANGKYLNAYIPANIPKEIYVSPENITNKSIYELLPKSLADMLLVLIKKTIESREMIICEYELMFNGISNQYEAHINAINNNEVIFSARNITLIKEIQAKLAAKVKELESKNEELEKYISSNLELENFAYVASHDLREPLRSIIGFSQLLQQKLTKTDNADVIEYLRFITESAQQMNILINDLLQYSLVNTEHTPKNVRTSFVVEKTILNLRELIHQTKAIVNVGELPDTIIGHEPKISQVFQNLIQNAIKFHQPNIAPIVTISSSETPTHWHFSVADNGIGISSEYFDKIFLLFRRLHTRKEFSGSGLGLAICKKIIDQHHGQIWVESEIGRGTTFHFTIAKDNNLVTQSNHSH